MLKRLPLLFILLILSMASYAVETRIHGNIENASGYVIRLKGFTDAVSMRDTILDECTIDDSGNFELNTRVEYPRKVVLKLGFQSCNFYIEPDRIYKFKIYYDPEKEQVSYLANHQLLNDFIDLPNNDLNALINNFNQKLDAFLLKNFYRVYRNKQFHLLDSLKSQMLSINREGSKYFDELVEYRIADIELAAKGSDFEMFFFEYFGNRPILYDHHDYMVLFNTFFNEYVKTKSKAIRLDELRKLVNDTDTPEELSKILKRDIVLMNDQFRELVILRDFYYYFYDFDFKPAKVLQHIRFIKNNSEYPEHRRIADKLIKRITELQPGSKMPSFVLEDISDNSKTNEDFIGKYLLLNFWELDCVDCFRNIDSLEYIQQTYANEINVVAVSGKKYTTELKQLMEEKDFNMQFLIASPDNHIYDVLKIRSLPAAILINDKGEILLYPAILPGRGFKNTFKAVFKK